MVRFYDQLWPIPLCNPIYVVDMWLLVVSVLHGKGERAECDVRVSAPPKKQARSLKSQIPGGCAARRYLLAHTKQIPRTGSAFTCGHQALRMFIGSVVTAAALSRVDTNLPWETSSGSRRPFRVTTEAWMDPRNLLKKGEDGTHLV